MGDPNGPIKFNGKYHLFWWGHLVSDDMINWVELTSNALKGTPAGFGNWSGSVVVDLDNTAEFNTEEDTAMIAVYTLNENSTGIQSQAISVSLNGGTFEYFDGNPVIPSTQRDFRDPQVFWHEESTKWVMVVTKPVDRAIEFYTSGDLKVWTYESKFEGRGAGKEVWEVPDLFKISVNGDPSSQKWILTCGMGPNRMQYWVGDFDGSKFTLDQNDNVLTGKHFPGDVFEDFEGGYSNWIVEGTAFGTNPATGTLPDQQAVSGFTGYQLVNSFENGDASVGKLRSQEFVIDKKFINFQIAGGTGADIGFNLFVDGQQVESVVSTSNTEVMQWRSIDVSEYIGKNAAIEIEDNATGGWGHILVDHIVFSDYEYDTRIENANWADWGYDFYAGKSYRNYDFDDDRKIWIAWMGNWTYARDVPTNPWKGCESIPRELSLNETSDGLRLIQKPVAELQQQRGSTYSKSAFDVNGQINWDEFHPEWNVYELKVAFKVTADNQVFGLNLAEGDDRKIEIKYDAHTSVLSVNRAKTPFSFAYKRITETPIFLKEDSVLDLHIFIDQSSIEIFANDYETSTTSLAFTDVNSTGVSLFSESGSVHVLSLEAWDLNSIWGITSDQVERPEEPINPLSIPGEMLSVYPNPVERGSTLTIDSSSFEEVAIADFSGRVLTTTRESTLHIPHSLDAGTYILIVQSHGSSFSKKIIIR